MPASRACGAPRRHPSTSSSRRDPSLPSPHSRASSYRLPPRISDLRGRLATPAGIEVLVRGGQLMIRVSTPVPALSRGLPLHPDDEDDPYMFRLDLSEQGMS